ncbi:MAG: RHS repeat-associated core domain-containing protein, partial [Acidobacteriota bacterium]
ADWKYTHDYVRGAEGIFGRRAANGYRRYLHRDHLGSLRLISSGAPTNAIETGEHHFYPFGASAYESGNDPLKAKYTGHERDPHKASDYMMGRTCVFPYQRFMSVDPGRDGWNLYAYVGNDPVRFVDPTGLALKIVYDFSDSGLSEGTQNQVVQGVRLRYIEAGVQVVHSYFRGGAARPSVEKETDAIVEVKITSDSLSSEGGKPVFGKARGSSVVISTEAAPEGQESEINFLVNVTAHEVGHGTKALPQYDGDGFPLGSVFFPRNAEAGSIMEQGPDANTRGASIREFSESDAIQLREALNP